MSLRNGESNACPGLVAVIREPNPHTLAVLYKEGIDYVLMPKFLIEQMLAVNRPVDVSIRHK